jgi:chemotaxis protein methyltransferase CheR
LSQDEIERFAEYFYAQTGIRFADYNQDMVRKKLLLRMKVLGLHTFNQYFTRVRFESSGRELQELINLLTINESYFFRELHQLQCLVEDVLPEIVQRKPVGEPLRIWTVPCARGEEPFSIAIYLMEHWEELSRVDVELMASDINTQALADCKKGIYSPRAVSRLPQNVLTRYFTPSQRGYALRPILRGAVRFSRVNVVDAAMVSQFTPVDVIFCRNLLIYFDEGSRQSVLSNFYDALAPGGALFLGSSESMHWVSQDFQVKQHIDTVTFHKPPPRKRRRR